MADDKRLFLTIANDLASVNDVLSKMAEIGKDELSLDELFVLSEFGARYLDTNKTIESAEKLAHEEALILQNDARELSLRTEQFINILPTVDPDLYSIDVKAKLDIYDKEQAKPYDEEREQAQSLWKQLSLARRILDVTTPDEEDYQELCDTVENLEKEYNASHNRVNELYHIYHSEQFKIAHLYYFDGIALVMLVAQLGDIARSVVSDIDNLRKEGRV